MMDELERKITKYIHELPVGEVAAEVNAALRQKPRVVVTAPPGAGKSTLLPLTIMTDTPEGRILMLEPRRLAARQVAQRMADMIGERVGQTVGYTIRFESRVSDRTRIEVVTEGILQRMLVDDPTLDGISVVIFDEFHERSLYSDIAYALTLEAQRLIRPDLKIVIMSATIDTDYICRRFDAPLIESKGRAYDVEIIRAAESDANTCVADTAAAIRRALREQSGDILAFLPGQGEIMKCRDLLANLPSDIYIHTLYGMMPFEEQRRTLAPSPAGTRKIVLSTPIAETSLTIEGIRTVVDSGFYKGMVFDARSGLSHLETMRISLDMARQRSGRAGRLSEGVCYRLWSNPVELRMKESRVPEIEEADLSSMVLDIAAWGESDVFDLPWLTLPPRDKVFKARQLLRSLGAVNDKGEITPHGRKLARIPCHPRIAQMLTVAEDNATKALGSDIAAILDEKDPINDENDCDITTRIIMLREARRRGNSGRFGRIIKIAEQYRRLVNAKEDNTIPDQTAIGALVALAYPERAAMMVADCRYRLANGDEVRINAEDALSSRKFLAIASLGKRIFLAAPIDEAVLKDMATWNEKLHWDNRQGRVVARRELRLGALLLDTAVSDSIDRARIIEAICEAAAKDGRSMFDFSDDVTRLIQRIETVAGWHPELDLPDVSVDRLLETAGEWLPLYIGDAMTVRELKRIDICQVVWGLLTYDRQQSVDAIAPSHYRLPNGRNVRLDYRVGADSPVLSARLEDCFGIRETPRVDGGTRPMLMELLSPGFKPVQLTKDIASFWSTTYHEVRKELRRRYPKHPWPENL
jgi:ATP-dependent helicase HrpB